jgi:eukaryotic-like serine/threonine-protein kinase
MNSAQPKAKTIFEQAVVLSDPRERHACLAEACAGDDALRREVESLLVAYERSASFLQTPLKPASPPLPVPGSREREFGGYELLEEVARGGMGVVYKARQASLNRVVALKMILAGHLASEAQVKRFHTEALAAASLDHPNIVGIHEVGEHQGQHYYTMPFLDSRSLFQLVQSGQWPLEDGTEAARIVAKLAHAVQYAHQAGILHRDLKPGNILIDPDGEPHLTDFGLAKLLQAEEHLTLTGDLMGTPGFMAPEQARGKSGQATSATDIYSLGAVLYYLLTGRPPFVADSAFDALFLVQEAEAVLPRRLNPQIPRPLEQICLRCLEKRPQDRYLSAGALAQDLERFLKGDPLAVNTKALGRRLETWARRRPALAARVGTVLLCLGIVIFGYGVRESLTSAEHRKVISLLMLWLIVSWLCQRGLNSERHACWVRFVWSGADPAVLTAILLVAHAFGTPLVVLFPTLIAASGLWLRVSLVATTAGMSLLGYAVLLADSIHRGVGIGLPYRHLLAVVAITVTGIAVAYLVNRVGALTRFYEHRPRA